MISGRPSTRGLLLLCSVLVVLIGTHGARAAQSDELAPLAFLIGQWQAIEAGNASGHCTFARQLQNRVIVRTNRAEYAATATRPANVHDDLMVIHVDSGKIRADYYDSEGHVIRYDVQVPKPSVAVFLSEDPPSATRYRLSYEAKENRIVEGKFEIAPPGKDFFTYLQWSMRRAGK